jgi:hypothetical protein
MVGLISLISIPVLILIAVILHVGLQVENPACNLVSGFFSLCLFPAAIMGTEKFLNNLGLFNEIGGLTFFMPVFLMFAFGNLCWSTGRSKGRFEIVSERLLQQWEANATTKNQDQLDFTKEDWMDLKRDLPDPTEED